MANNARNPDLKKASQMEPSMIPKSCQLQEASMIPIYKATKRFQNSVTSGEMFALADEPGFLAFAGAHDAMASMTVAFATGAHR